MNYNMKTAYRELKNLGYILFASILFAIAISLFFDPNHIAPGGLSGIAILIHYFVPIKTGTIIFLLNVPLLFLGFRKLGSRFLIYTLLTTVLASTMMNITANLPPITQDRLLASVAGGALFASSIALVFRIGATSGGMDIVVKLIHLKHPHIHTGKIFLLLDMMVVVLSIFVFDNVESGLYAAIAVYVSSLVMDFILYGSDEAKLIFVISSKEQEISHYLLNELKVGVTILSGKGAYANTPHNILMCALKKQFLPTAIHHIKSIDNHTFMIVTSASEIFGEGFKP